MIFCLSGISSSGPYGLHLMCNFSLLYLSCHMSKLFNVSSRATVTRVNKKGYAGKYVSLTTSKVVEQGVIHWEQAMLSKGKRPCNKEGS
jgi:hypothetical protein